MLPIPHYAIYLQTYCLPAFGFTLRLFEWSNRLARTNRYDILIKYVGLCTLHSTSSKLVCFFGYPAVTFCRHLLLWHQCSFEKSPFEKSPLCQIIRNYTQTLTLTQK